MFLTYGNVCLFVCGEKLQQTRVCLWSSSEGQLIQDSELQGHCFLFSLFLFSVTAVWEGTSKKDVAMNF